MKPAIASLFALGTTFCLMGTKTRHEVPTFGTSTNCAHLSALDVLLAATTGKPIDPPGPPSLVD